MEQAPLARDIAEAAAGWLLRLETGEADRDAWLAWRAANPEHERAWRRIEALGLSFKRMPAPVAKAALDRPRAPARRRAIKQLAVLLAVGAVGSAGQHQLPWRSWSADLRTAVGERREFALPDGSQLQLNTASAVDLRFDAETRRVQLRAGEILIETAADPARRPFFVDTAFGRVRALGTRFTVRLDADGARVTVHEHAVMVEQDGRPPRRVDAGQRIHFDAEGTGAALPAETNAQAWTRGLIHADDMPLATLAAELARYRGGWLRCDPAVAALRVSGAFPIDKPDAALALLERTLPVRVERRFDWWVVLAPR